MISDDLSVVLPEIILSVYAMLALVGAVYTGKDRAAPVLVWTTSALMLALAVWIGLTAGPTETAFGGALIDDGFARFAKVVVLASAALVMLMSQDYMRRQKTLLFEFPVLITLAVVGMMLMVSAGDLMTLYMGLELQSLALYVVAAIRRDNLKSTEAGLKYFVLGALSSGLLLYGASLTYGYSGTTLFAGILASIGDGPIGVGLLFGLVFMITGLAFKVSAVPFHMWTPDVYEGAPTPVTAFFATAPKMAAMALFARVLFDAFGSVPGDWGQVIAVLSLLSMFLGAFAGIGQRNFKRLMAYSSIAHMGFALMGLVAGTALGVQAMLVYMAIYVTMSIGTFAFIMGMQKDGQPVVDIRSLNMYASVEPLKALALMMLLFSLAGVPPFVGFFGKFYVIKAAVDGGYVWLAVAGVIASVISAFYYLRIVFYMYFGEEGDRRLDGTMPPVMWGIMMVASFAMIVGVINLFGVEGLALAAAQTLVN
ncbi:NADH-quinone oxidoreductase subunit N [Rhodovulum sulfidophilum]|uniref:NADH-quinone oxidoreductase subunit N n=1 Tax=Rhodovulum visakhapatnamense TaxID=364297 RepID=A0A4R8GA28_9RHOB|nr:NADH-quinone oxidoreductase subunit NuoN [Rhodovulum visakhapatnamense]MBL3568532.1 NADH-quinone oxidoreductase subunit NuoN [Rhodovulum visakhapatnamense]MBL3579292.1 NADH-quinone oxidoreductase subunit NuoN [Rhodovulum visakhapatnamense]OLS45597.1 NADH-quinone oxidoreductase subunit N [Rhodovulum sulfidophilum]TDX33716.1 NADH dehydrogenase subunit N [Rhodovulum visakhapatnamense]